MAIDNDLSTPLLEVRLCIGDSDGTLMTDSTINALLAINDNNVPKTCVQALQAIVADLAKNVNEEVGDTKEWLEQQYRHYKDLLDKVTKDPAYLAVSVSHSFGGVSASEIGRVNNNSDSRGPGIRQGQFTSDDSTDGYYNTGNPFFLSRY